MTLYDPDTLRRYYDDYGDREWDRLESDLRHQISYAIHRRFLLEHARPGIRALDVGCGPGRFALDLLQVGARVTLADLSPVQLESARARIDASGLASGLDGAHLADVCALPDFPAPFDLVAAYGGVLSYTCEAHPQAIDQLLRATAPGGVILVSVMPIGGTMRLIPPLDAVGFLEGWDQHMQWDLAARHPGYVLTVPGSPEWHQPLALFSAAYLREQFEARGCEVLTVAAASPICTLFPTPQIEASAEASDRLMQLELALCETPELAESGTHMILVVHRH